MRREPSKRRTSGMLSSLRRAPITRFARREACFALVTCCCGRSFKHLMKAKFEEWRASDGRLDFCPRVFEEKRAGRAVRTVTSNFAHPYAGNIVSKRTSKHPAPFLASQYAVFGAKTREKTHVVVQKCEIRVEGFEEFLKNLS